MRLYLALSLVGLVLLGVQRAGATPISVLNFSFESPFVGDGGSLSIPDTGVINQAQQDWHVDLHPSTNVIVRNPFNEHFSGTTGLPGTLPGTADGRQYLRIFGIAFFDFAIVNYLPHMPAEAGTTYSLTVALGKEKNLEVGSAEIIILLDGIEVATRSVFAPNGEIPNDSFADFTTSYTTVAGDAGKDLRFRLRGSGPGGVAFDNVRLDAETAPSGDVPEPSTLALLVAGGLALVRRRAHKWGQQQLK